MDEDRLQVLQLLSAGRITADQAMGLLDALRLPERAGAERGTALRVVPPPVVPRGGESRWLRLRVLDGRGRSKVDLQLPLGVLGLFLRVGSRWLPQLGRFDPDLVLAAMQWRGNGKVFEVADEGGDRVEISVE